MAAIVTSKSLKQPIEQNDENNQEISNKIDTMTALEIFNNDETTISRRENDVIYDVEHLATFSTAPSHETTTNENPSTIDNNDDFKNVPQSFNNSSNYVTKPRVALQKLFELEKLSGIWTQRMQIELRGDLMLIIDCETNSIVERFNRDCVTKPEAFNQYNDIYNNIVVFAIQQGQLEKETKSDELKAAASSSNGTENRSTTTSVSDKNNDKLNRRKELDQLNSETPGELHIFQCVSHKAQQLVSDILAWKSSQTTSSRREEVEASDTSKQQVNMTKKNESESLLATTQDTTRNGKPSNDNRHNAHNQDTEKSLALSSRQRQVVDKKSNGDGEQTNRNKPTTTVSNGALNGQPANGNSKPVVMVASSTSASENVPIVNVNVKETVQVFNQIAALREKG